MKPTARFTVAALLLALTPTANAALTQSWTRQLGTSSWDFSNGIATDSSGNSYITGFTGGDMDGNGNQGRRADAFVSLIDTDGHLIWTKQFGSSGSDWGNGLSVDNTGNIFITGGNMDGNGNKSGRDVFITKFTYSPIVPEPGTLALLSSLAGLALARKTSR